MKIWILRKMYMITTVTQMRMNVTWIVMDFKKNELDNLVVGLANSSLFHLYRLELNFFAKFSPNHNFS